METKKESKSRGRLYALVFVSVGVGLLIAVGLTMGNLIGKVLQYGAVAHVF